MRTRRNATLFAFFELILSINCSIRDFVAIADVSVPKPEKFSISFEDSR